MLLIRNATLIDCTGADPRPHVSVLIEGQVIQRVGTDREIEPPRGAAVIEAGGRTLLPGLMDAHVHFGITDLTAEAINRQPGAVYAMQVARAIESTIDHGFTTVRDAGDLDGGWAYAV